MIIVLIGKMGSGKTTIARYLVNNYNFNKIAFADRVKELAIELFDMKEKNRSLLINLAEKMKNIDSNVWINATFKKIDKYLENNNNIVIDDCRFKNEYDALKMKYNNLIFIKLEISKEEQEKRLKNIYTNFKDHINCKNDYSEHDLNNSEYDYLLHNSSFENTQKLLDHIVNIL